MEKCFKMIKNINKLIVNLRPVAGAQIVTVKSTDWVRSPLEEMKYLSKFIFSLLRSGV